MQSRKIGDPLDKETFQGPQGDKLQQERILALIENGKQNAELVLGGKDAKVNGKV
jgi:aldehyde dehydrogenase (NAD+)